MRSQAAAATGRILIWRGGSLWIGRAGEPARPHAHHAIQVSLAFPGHHVKVRLPGGAWKNHPAILVAAQQRHEFDARGQCVAQLFVEPESREGRGLQLRHRQSGMAALDPAAQQRELAALVRAYEARADDATLATLARDTIRVLADTADHGPSLDERIGRAVERVRGRLDGRIALRDVAVSVNLSPERFRHLFVEQTGVRFRAYVLWLRLEVALAAYVRGATLTEAAHAGGFADSAHLSRTFRNMFGISAASIRLE